MNNSFISIVIVLESVLDKRLLSDALSNLQSVLEGNFPDYEVILVNNSMSVQFDEEIQKQEPSLRRNIFLLTLSSPVLRNHAIVAGLDRANGDYTVLLERSFFSQPELMLSLYQKAASGADIVYLRAPGRQAGLRFRLMYRFFYWIFRNFSKLEIDERAHDTRIISRRALNSMLRLRENLRFMKAIYSLIGYKTSSLAVDVPLESENTSFTDKFRTFLVAITSFTDFLRTMLLWIFIGSICFMLLVIVNAVKVKLTSFDLLGSYQSVVPGWTFLVVMNSIFFAATCLMLYIMSVYLSNIYQEIKQRPMYIIESIRRF
jgi:dolichol-phosphate mannosyltransferase